MPEESDPQREGRHSTAWWLGICGAILFYFLSPPPLAWVYERFNLGNPAWPRYVYAPIIFLYSQFEPVEQFYDGYAKLLNVKL